MESKQQCDPLGGVGGRRGDQRSPDGSVIHWVEWGWGWRDDQRSSVTTGLLQGCCASVLGVCEVCSPDQWERRDYSLSHCVVVLQFGFSIMWI